MALSWPQLVLDCGTHCSRLLRLSPGVESAVTILGGQRLGGEFGSGQGDIL